jgi:hypothetical protein
MDDETKTVTIQVGGTISRNLVTIPKYILRNLIDSDLYCSLTEEYEIWSDDRGNTYIKIL